MANLELVEIQHLFPFPPLGVSGLDLGLASLGAQPQRFPLSLAGMSGNGHPTSNVGLGFGRSLGLSGFMSKSSHQLDSILMAFHSQGSG